MLCIRSLLILLLEYLFVCGAFSNRFDTCSNLNRELKNKDKKIEELKLELQEYEIAFAHKIEDETDECNSILSCSQCQSSETDPECGWCFLRGRCSLKKHCPDADDDVRAWLPTGSQKCPMIQSLSPESIALRKPRSLNITIPGLPDYKGNFICSFKVNGSQVLKKAIRAGNDSLLCSTPELDHLSNFNQSVVNSILSVRTAKGPDFVTTEFSVYNCESFRSCMTCVSSTNCNWCLLENRCSSGTDANCPEDMTVVRRQDDSTMKASEMCPSITSSATSISEILVQHGTTRRFQFRLENIKAIMIQMRVRCYLEGHPTVGGQLLGDTVYCEPMKFSWHGSDFNASVHVIFDDEIELDNPHNIHVVSYDCSRLASSPSSCRQLPEQYQCGWCEGKRKCTVRDMCLHSPWLDRTQKPKEIMITSIHPDKCVIGLNTKLTIKGENLGEAISDIEEIRLVDENNETIQCEPFPGQSNKTDEITCLLKFPNIAVEDGMTIKGVVELVIGGKRVVWKKELSFINPVINTFSPVKGPRSGGTILEIDGQHLYAGCDIHVAIGSSPCETLSLNSTKIRCITTEAKIGSSRVRVMFGGDERSSDRYFFYVEDPLITDVMKAKGTPSGGNEVQVYGQDLDSIQYASMHLFIDEEEHTGACRIQSPTLMCCKTPAVSSQKLIFCDNAPLELHYGFRLDALKTYINASGKGRVHNSFPLSIEKFRLYPDPHFLPFSEEGRVKRYRSDHSDYLEIKGRNLHKVHEEGKFKVMIGDVECPLLWLSETYLLCKPQNVQPDLKETKLYCNEVKVILEGREYFIGFLIFD